MSDPLAMTRVARERRQAVWEQGHNQAAALDKAGHFTPPDDLDAYERFLYLQGIANYCVALGREGAGLDERPATAVSLLGVG